MQDSQALADKVKQVEGKLAALQAINQGLQKENDKLRRELARIDAPPTDAEEELEELREEFQTRLGAQDRLIAALQDEKAKLQASVAEYKRGGSASEAKVTELQQTIDGLKAEGITLSKRAGDLEASQRKLRSTLRDVEGERDRLQARVKALDAHLLESQESAEKAARTAAVQMEALEREAQSAQVQARQAIADAKRQVQDAMSRAESEAAKGGAQISAAAQEREASLVATIAELQGALGAAENEAANREDMLRRQAHRLEEHIRQLEGEKEELAASAGDASKPLLRQIQSMAASAAAAQEAADAAEASLLQRLRVAEGAAATAAAAERIAASRAAATEASVASAREAAAAAVAEVSELQGHLEREKRGARALAAERGAAEERLSATQARLERARSEAEAMKRDLTERLWDAEQRARNLQKEKSELLERVEACQSQGLTYASTPAPTNSSNARAGAASLQGEHLTAPGSSEQGNPKGQGSMQDGVGRWGPGSGEAVLEEQSEAETRDGLDSKHKDELDLLLQSFSESAAIVAAQQQAQRAKGGGIFGLWGNNKDPSHDVNIGKLQRTVELLQRRMLAAERARDTAAEQLCRAFQHADALQASMSSTEQLRQQLADMEKRCDVALEIIGERNERVEQIEEDLKDCRTIFHEQLEECVRQLGDARAELDRLKQQQQN
ncbi:hypothetical protein DUNSADRAFT_11394 [Dunaliella salina]|uniref:TATA element modulatory factor 1 TATA binding domain-containing protein n=1 Tax=Dunaliella salina TaxID=3046 RepID=A0ABQ7GDH4_DUNSA|nr:hypothetical protein DUNSADRAFT_11394 [Dunaliella salina]|eukprot:KAF5832649.1 hypothetical protein DUNSADRAFT_11394 [Dunaliella salina]